MGFSVHALLRIYMRTLSEIIAPDNIVYNTHMDTVVAIIGAGKIGQAIAAVVSKKAGIITELWDADTTKIPGQKPLAEIIPRASIVFVCTPSWATRGALTSIKPYLSKTAIIISPCKGLEKGTGARIDEVIATTLPTQPYGLLLGSMLADELLASQPGVAAIACADDTTTRAITELFHGTLLHIHPTNDIVGAAYAGVLKDIYAILIGVINGLKYKDDVRGYMASRVIDEMQALICALGGHEDTCLSAPGAGDFLSTAYSPLSRNREFGEALITGAERPKTVEGVVALPLIVKKLGEKLAKYPLLTVVHAIVEKQADARATVEALL